MTTILEDRYARFMASDIHLRAGTGKGANGTIDVCLVQAADWLAGGSGETDTPECVSRKIGRYCIGLNDSLLFKQHRDLLKPYAAKIVGTAGESGEREVQRSYLLADYAVRVFAPIWLRADPQHRFDERAAKLEALAPITDKATRAAARDAAYAAAAADAAAAAYTASAAAAADIASAAYTADAADAAYAAYAAYAADAARIAVLAEKGDELRAMALRCLDELIALQ